MKSKLVLGNIALAAAASAPSVAFAHVGGHGDMGLVSGLSHPISGLDHVLAMVMVGLLASQVGGRATWLAPAAFVSAMVVGGVLGATGVPLRFFEVGIALSVVVLGFAVALSMRISTAIAVGLAALFAVFHGYAHGFETPDNANGVAYVAGFLATTSFLIGASLLVGKPVKRGTFAGVTIVRSLGSATALAGVVLLQSAIVK